MQGGILKYFLKYGLLRRNQLFTEAGKIVEKIACSLRDKPDHRPPANSRKIGEWLPDELMLGSTNLDTRQDCPV